MKVLLGIVLAGNVSGAASGALQDCTSASGSSDPSRVVFCLRNAKQAATEQMLERFLGVEQTITALGTEAGRAREALKQSQRAFERYLLEHCNGLQGLITAGEAASLACEADLLRQRTDTLEALEGNQQRI